MQQMTFTNIFIVDGKPVDFLDLPEEEKARIGSLMARIPLETLGEVQEIKTA